MTLKVERAGGARQAPSPPTHRVIAVMGLLASEPERTFSLAEIVRSLGISRATGHAILTTLADHDWVIRDPHSAGYSRGPALPALARPAESRAHRDLLQALADSTGSRVFLARRDAGSIVVTDTAGDSLTGPRIDAGFRTPLVAPFGRDYVAWSGAAAQQAWLAGIGTPNSAFRSRISAVLDETRRRGFVVERLSREYVRVYAALRALGGDGEVDAITTRLAAAFADLTVVDVLPDEWAGGAAHSIATVSAPIADPGRGVAMSLSAAPFATLDGCAVGALGQQVRTTAQQIETRLARYGPV